MPAIPLPNGKTVFLDDDGAPLEDGTVAHYEPGGLTPKDTWQNYGQTILNDNPLDLDGAGRAVIFGAGRYRQIVKRADGTTAWDQETVGYLTPATSYAYLQASFSGSSPPGSSAQLGYFPIPAAATFPANFASPTSYFHCDVNPSAPYVITVLKNGSSVGSITIATNGTATFATSGGAAFTVAAGDRITLTGQVSADATLNNFGFTLVGTWT